jgi:hypothetical protein
MDPHTDTADDYPPIRREVLSGRSGDDLRSLVGSANSSPNKWRPADTAGLRSLVGIGDSTRAVAESSTSAISALVGSSPGSSPKAASDLTELVGGAVPRRDDRGWMAPELAQPARRPRFASHRRGGSVGILSIIVAVVAVAALAGTTTLALVQRATANPAAEAMNGLREREAELQNEIQGLQTSTDLLTSVVEGAEASSRAAAGVFPGLRGRVEDEPLNAADSARAALDSAISSVPVVVVPVYRRDAVDEQSLEVVGHALDEVRRAREALPPLVTEVRTARSGVASALEDFRAHLRDLGASIETTAARVVETQDAAGESFRQDVTDAAASLLSAQRSGADGLAEMASFAAAVDALNAENARVLEEPTVRTRYTPPAGGSPSPTTPNSPTDPGDSGVTDPSTPTPSDPGTGGTDQPAPDPSPTSGDDGSPGDTPTP